MILYILINIGRNNNLKKKIKILCYECKNCNKRVYYQSDTNYDTKCKTCKNDMQFICENNYNPNSGIQAIKISNVKGKYNTEFNDPIIECPYCHSTNTKKITDMSKILHTALFGIFSMGRNRFANALLFDW